MSQATYARQIHVFMLQKKSVSPSSSSDSVLPGPEIAFRPVHQKSSANFEKSSANLILTSMQRSTQRPIEMKIKFCLCLRVFLIRVK
jgi:hypothetical protein